MALRLRPVPDVAMLPLHERPLDALLATLRSCTNLLVAPDPKDPGHSFPGWAKVPDC